MAVAARKEVLALSDAMEAIGRGWTQGAYFRKRSGAAPDEPEQVHRVDLCWALQVACEWHGVDPEQLRNLVTGFLPEPYRSDLSYGLERWNDALWRTRNEAIFLLGRVRDSL